MWSWVLDGTGHLDFWGVVERIAAAAVIGLAAAFVMHEVRLSRIESNRFTYEDGIALERRLLEQLPPDVVA